jgi:hypothetical protein
MSTSTVTCNQRSIVCHPVASAHACGTVSASALRLRLRQGSDSQPGSERDIACCEALSLFSCLKSRVQWAMLPRQLPGRANRTMAHGMPWCRSGGVI